MCLVQDWLISNAFNEVFGETGLPGSGKKFWKMKKKIQVREKSGKYIFSQGNSKKMKKVMEKSGNFLKDAS